MKRGKLQKEQACHAQQKDALQERVRHVLQKHAQCEAAPARGGDVGVAPALTVRACSVRGTGGPETGTKYSGKPLKVCPGAGSQAGAGRERSQRRHWSEKRMSGLQPSPISMACADFMKHAEKDILGMCFQFGRKRMEVEAISSFTTSILFKVDHTRV